MLWWGDLKDGDHLEDLGVDGMIILGWMLKKWDREKKTTQPGASCSEFLTECYPADNIKKNEMGGTCGTYGVKCWKT